MSETRRFDHIERVVRDERRRLDDFRSTVLARMGTHTHGGGGGGVTDHGALTGLTDDDHPQYLNQARGDARYYTETESDAFLAGKSDTGHLHDARYYTETETDSLLGGKAATSHGHAQADVSGLVTDLAGKAALAHTHGVTDLTATGTRDGTTFLRGDNTWAVPPSGGGGPAPGDIGSILYAVKTAATTSTVFAWAADPHLSVSIPAAGTWEITGYLIAKTADIATDIFVRMDLSGTDTHTWSLDGPFVSNTDVHPYGLQRSNAKSGADSQSRGLITSSTVLTVAGLVFKTSGTATAYTVSWAPTAGGTAVTMMTNSYLKLQRIA